MKRTKSEEDSSRLFTQLYMTTISNSSKLPTRNILLVNVNRIKLIGISDLEQKTIILRKLIH